MIFIHLLRMHQWSKNLLLFSGIFFSKKLLDTSLYQNIFIGFLSFCLLSSFIYIINDILDHKVDKLHPIKKLRPIASKAISIRKALLIAFIILSASLYLAFKVYNDLFLLIWFSYLLLMILYSFYIKHLAIIDVCVLGLGFVLRTLAGSVLIFHPFSLWLTSCTFFVSLFLGFSKRKNELHLLNNANEHRLALKNYSNKLLNLFIIFFGALSFLTYLSYTLSAQTIIKFNQRPLVISNIFVLSGIIRYFYLIYKKKEGGQPDKLLFTDVYMIGFISTWLLSLIIIIYGG